MLNIGITGGIGVGKTTVCKIFEMLGIPVYYADDRAKQLMTDNNVVKAKIKALLGNEAYYEDGNLNRDYIRKKAFKDGSLLQQLNAIVHPAVSVSYTHLTLPTTSP